MNRRDFLRLAGVAALGIFVPKKAGTMLPNSTNRYGDMLREFYDGMKNNNLSEVRLNEIVRVFNELSQREQIYRSWMDTDGKVKADKMNLPIEPIYLETLSSNKSEIVIDPVPTKYKHLMFIGSGRTTGAGTANRALCAEFNSDTGANYNEQDVYGVTTTPISSGLYGNIYFYVGMLAEGGQAAGKAGSFFSVLPHYVNSTVYKSGVMMCTASNGSNYHSILATSFWNNTNPISRIRLFSSSDSIASGSVISVYGIL